jgi:DNA adenine methylase
METKSNKLKRLLYCYSGSKWRLASQLVQFFPPHRTYLCPFLGTGSEFAVKERSRREIANDLDDNIYSVFSVLRDQRQFRQLIRLLENSHDCRRLYYESYDLLKGETLTPLERAYRFLICGNIGFQGGHPMRNRSYRCGTTKTPQLKSLLPAVLAWRDRMKDVEVEHLDAFKLLDLYDQPDVFAFCDPPYHPETCKRGLYTHYLFDHHRFVKRLQQFKGKAMVCGYEHGLYDVQLLGWRRVTFNVKTFLGGQAPRTEVIWMNYDETGAKIDQDLGLIQAFERLPA